jgi:DNA-binding NarL/FixJ family response regulator
MSRRYANAQDVLPAKLVARVQRHYSGLLWVPAPPPEEIVERNEQIQRMHLDGVSVTEIAQQVGLSERRVWQIIR